MERLNRMSSAIGLLSALCAAPTAVRAIASGSFPDSALRDLIAVSLIYAIVRYAERQMR